MPRFSDALIDHATSPRSRGPLPNANCVGVAGMPGNGPWLVVRLRIEHDGVVESAFECHGCGVTVAAGSALMELVDGLGVTGCRSLTVNHVSAVVDGFPPDKEHCGVMAIAALKNALETQIGEAGEKN